MREWQAWNGNPVADFLVPISYSTLSRMTECPLRLAFSRDKSYPPRVDPRARMGTAFHESLAFISKEKQINVHKIIESFVNSMKKERVEAFRNYRERRLPWPKEVREAMENILVLKVCSMNVGRTPTKRRIVENTLVSADGMLIGRPDEVLIGNNGPVIIDYKTGRFNEEYLCSYEEQIHFYAGLWGELYGDTPKIGRIEFIVADRHHDFTIDSGKAKSLLDRARDLAQTLRNPDSRLFKPTIGDHCRFCDYRPWCYAYWMYNNTENIETRPDIAGTICNIHPRDSQALCIDLGSSHLIIVNRRLDPLPPWNAGTSVRALDLSGQGSTRFLTARSEFFYVDQDYLSII